MRVTTFSFLFLFSIYSCAASPRQRSSRNKNSTTLSRPFCGEKILFHWRIKIRFRRRPARRKYLASRASSYATRFTLYALRSKMQRRRIHAGIIPLYAWLNGEKRLFAKFLCRTDVKETFSFEIGGSDLARLITQSIYRFDTQRQNCEEIFFSNLHSPHNLAL